MSTPSRPRPPGVRRSERAKFVSVTTARLLVNIDKLCSESGLTVVELLQALNQYEASLLRDALREERHPEDPGRPADEE